MNSRLDSSRQKFAEYAKFSVGEPEDSYRLHVADYMAHSTAGDSLILNSDIGNLSEMMFTTKDVDNDLSKENCATEYSGGWWYRKCFHANLNAAYPPHDIQYGNCGDFVELPKYMSWESFNDCFGDIIYSIMGIVFDAA